MEIITEIIREKLSQIGTGQLSILFAVESGSRAWGFNSVDSDYDVRFVYYYPQKEYLKVHSEVSKQIQLMISEEVGSRKIQFDFVGWDIYKYLRLFQKSNPATIEWLYSSIIYIENDKRKKLQSLAQNFSKKGLFFHYLSIANSQFEKHLKQQKMVSVKKVLYLVRGVTNAIYILLTKKFPPIKFNETILELKKIRTNNYKSIHQEFVKLSDQISDLIELKTNMIEEELIPFPNPIITWTIEKIKELFAYGQTLDDKIISKDKLNLFLFEILKV